MAGSAASSGSATTPNSAYYCLPEPSGVWAMVDDKQMPLTTEGWLDAGAGEAMPTAAGSVEEAVPATGSELAKVEEAASSVPDFGQYWGSRNMKNKPEGISPKTWSDGVSATPLPGWTEQTFWFCPRPSWQQKKLYLHPTATAADVKWVLQKDVQMGHSSFCLFGLDTQAKVSYDTQIFAASRTNPAPLQELFAVPTARPPLWLDCVYALARKKKSVVK